MKSAGAWTIWFTGLSGSGKSTFAVALSHYLKELRWDHELIDGDKIRRDLCWDLGFSKQDRDENVRRISCVAHLLNSHGVIAIVAAIAPYRQARLEARARCSHFIEVHVDCSLPTLTARDVKGLYKRAMDGSLQSFSGISDPYEAPEHPDIYINSETHSPEESIEILLSQLEALGALPDSNTLHHGSPPTSISPSGTSTRLQARAMHKAGI